MPQLRPPLCRATLETGFQCGVAMKPVGERHPSFGPNYKPGGWVFECPYCGAVRYLDDQHADRQMERYR